MIDCVISSPPFLESLSSGDTSSSFKAKYPDAKTGGDWGQSYGDSTGQLGSMKPGTLEGATMSTAETAADCWENCYVGGWQGLICPEAFAHPAKYSYSLICRIVQHAYEMGWVKRGDLVADPFGGVGTGGIVCGYQGLRWVGCELEPRFVALARQNFELHRARMECAGDPLPQIIQGDSRQLASVLEAADCVVSSPPYATETEKLGKIDWSNATYSNPESGNLGNDTGDTFWHAARKIVAQCYAILRPQGHACWVTKDFVRKGARVCFTDDWVRLCESCGFRLVCRHRAMLVKEQTNPTLFDGQQTTKKERKSFFRRLAEKKGSPAIDWEEVTCFVKEKQ